MDTIHFRVTPTEHDYVAGIEIRVNGISLIDLARVAELPFAEAEGAPRIAGAYSGLPAAVYLPPSGHFWGQAEWPRPDGKVEVLTCRDCGEIGCWPLLARICVEGERVIWSDFEQPHRRGGPTIWSLAGLGPFVFNLVQYSAALDAAAASLHPVATPE